MRQSGTPDVQIIRENPRSATPQTDNCREIRHADDDVEWMVPIRWIHTVPQAAAYWEKGLFANQNSACKLRQEFTLDKLSRHFGVQSDGE